MDPKIQNRQNQLDGQEQVLIPGDPEREMEAERLSGAYPYVMPW